MLCQIKIRNCRDYFEIVRLWVPSFSISKYTWQNLSQWQTREPTQESHWSEIVTLGTVHFFMVWEWGLVRFGTVICKLHDPPAYQFQSHDTPHKHFYGEWPPLNNLHWLFFHCFVSEFRSTPSSGASIVTQLIELKRNQFSSASMNKYKCFLSARFEVQCSRCQFHFHSPKVLTTRWIQFHSPV